MRSVSRTGEDEAAVMLTCDVVHVVLPPLLHAVHILLEADWLVARLRGWATYMFCNFGAVCGVLMDAELQALAKLLIEFLVVMLLFRSLRWQIRTLPS